MQPRRHTIQKVQDILLDPSKNPLFYELVHSVFTPANKATILNWGYAPYDEDTLARLPQQPLQAQLYKETFQLLDRPPGASATICEISCGQGSGLSFIRSMTNAKKIGLERSFYARQRARKLFGLEVRKTLGPNINLPDQSADILLSVEAAHNYFGQHFVSEIYRCLKPGGTLLITDVSRMDIKREHPRDRISRTLERGGLTVVKWRDITNNVIEALKIDNDRKMALVDRIPKLFQKTAYNNYCTANSAFYKKFMTGERYYYLAMAVRNS